jgi:hypothetical protein
MRARTLALLTPLACALLLPGCGKPKAAANSLDAMDSALINGAVTAERSTLAGAIKVDPAKLHASRQDRPATTSLAELARRQAAHLPATPAGEAPVAIAATGDMTGVDPAIADGLVYSNNWAKKLPADLPMMAGAALQEAAGRDGGPLTMRVVSFTAPGDRSAVLAWYAQKARAAGYSAARVEKDGDLVLQGEKPDGASYVIMAGATTGGRTPVDYVWTKS